MEFKVSADLVYNAEEAGTLVLTIRALNGLDESCIIDPGTIQYQDHSSATQRPLVLRITDPGEITISYTARALNPFKYLDFAHLQPTPTSQMDPAVMLYMNPSRYCESDKLLKFATHLFGHIRDEFEKVIAITEWIYNQVEYQRGSTTGQTSAFDTITQQVGVCRDFAHLGIALCRALDIPARYCSTYAYQLKPQDFHACFEAYLSGHWVIFDATKLVPLNGLVKIATGRDAADTAVANLFGNINGLSMKVNAELTEGIMEPVYYYPGSTIGISYV